MLKSEEIRSTNSCFNKANSDETLFVLLGRDPAAPAAVKTWIAERIRLGKNSPADDQILNALECVMEMEEYYKRRESSVEVARLTNALHQSRCHPDYTYKVVLTPLLTEVETLRRSGWEPNLAYRGGYGESCWRKLTKE